MTAAVPAPRFRDQLAEFIARHANPFWRAWTDEARAEAIREWQLLLTGEPLNSYLAAEVEARVQAAEQRGYERGRRDFQFAPEGDNHHNSALCPYCSPRAQAAANQRAAEAMRAAALEQLDEANAVPDTDEGTHADGHRCAADFLIRRANLIAALASPAPAPSKGTP